MLSVEEAPVTTVPLMAEDWKPEPVASSEPAAPSFSVEPPAPAVQTSPAQPRFLSEDEERGVAPKPAVEMAFFSAPETASDSDSAPASAQARNTNPFASQQPAAPQYLEQEPEAAPARPRFAELAEEPAYSAQPGYVSAYDGGIGAAPVQEERYVLPTNAVFSEPEEESQRDLDVPAFMRRLQF
jgi:hypothetical protein